ncbi:DUF2865 domain-containing protein [Ciceribacter thiooxidans]|uniref:DUF2865 domain-containing protein n=1 Tax=Ciceribacter thiooxidans TaxID=1969821 RepID=A0ABV7I114_9HYPH|nr:DUF2865 domain-containing protein [Ciceribacter thiooxidans]
MPYRRRLALLSVMVLATLPAPAISHASMTCDRLRASLASEPEVVSDTAAMRRFSSAIARQNFQIRKARQRFFDLHCGSPSVIDYTAMNRPECATLSAEIKRLEEDKQQLVDRRDAARNGATQPNEVRQRILDLMEANHCDEEPVKADVTPAEPPRTPYLDMVAPRLGPDGLPTGGWRNGAGNLQTLCVRTCDGAFFPISSNTTPLTFRRDAELCRQMCPGIETELYFRSVTEPESGEMISTTTGRPYRQSPTAFAYQSRRKGDQPSCTCNLTEFYRRMKTQAAGANVPDYNSSVIDLKTAGKPAPEKAEPSLPVERPYDPAEKKVRQVGPVFLPSETSGIDLRHPALSGPQPVQQ